MENSTTSSNNKFKFIMPVSVMAIIAITAVLLYEQQQSSDVSSKSQTQPQVVTMTPSPTSDAAGVAGGTVLNDAERPQGESNYVDGTYEAKGVYTTPGGEREVVVSVTMTDDVVTAATFQGFATDPASKRFQGEFAEGFQAQVIGKNIDELNLQKISGSSLTPKGFMNALETIKVQAQG
jgi:uncharacterized protein with FMN-binding domain